MAEHSTLTGSSLHEPKGVAAASADQIYIADGSGSGDWRYLPHGFFYYDDIGTGTTISTPTAYTLIGPATTTDSDISDFTHNSLGRLTYTGAHGLALGVISSVSFKHSTGGGTDCYFQLHKNGVAVAGAQQVVTADSANYFNVALTHHVSVVRSEEHTSELQSH